MQVLCQASSTGNDVRCPVCGQGFLVYWTQREPEERSLRRAEVLKNLRAQHSTDQSVSAHPSGGFNLPDWDGDSHVSAAALIGNAPAWATI